LCAIRANRVTPKMNRATFNEPETIAPNEDAIASS
jgi:hypothetical protein